MAKNQCNYCQNEISGYRVRCAVCPEFDLCLQCFSFGAEIGGHKKEHGYQISDRPLRIVTDDDEGSESGKREPAVGAFDVDQPWSLAEETMLLDAVEQYGFGNWEDVAGHVESREPGECEQHYVNFFIRGNVGKGTFSNEPFGKVIDHTCPDGGPLSPSITVPVTPLELNLQEQHELGYMPFRDDFEREYDNEAETLVSSLSIHYDDEDLDIAIKLAQVEKYRMRLKERERRKRLAREYGLITAAAATAVGTPGAKANKTPGPKKKGSKDERELLEKLKPFSQHLSKAEHQMYLENLLKQKEVKSRIKELLRFRKNGITKLDDIEEFEEEKFLREKKKENRKKLVSLGQTKRNSMASKKAIVEEKLDILIDDDGPKDEDEVIVSKEMSDLPGFDMISKRERRLCTSIGMTPGNYITIKTCIIKDYLQRRQGIPVKIRYPSGMDKTHRRKIMSFLTDNGWIGVT